MNEADRGKVVYRGHGVDAFQRFMEALVERGETNEPLVVEVHRGTAIVPVESPAAVTAYPLVEMPLAQTLPAYGTRTDMPRQYGRNPSSLGDKFLDAYAISLELLDALWSGVKRSCMGRN